VEREIEEDIDAVIDAIGRRLAALEESFDGRRYGPAVSGFRP
jgi:hypothetical protein